MYVKREIGKVNQSQIYSEIDSAEIRHNMYPGLIQRQYCANFSSVQCAE